MMTFTHCNAVEITVIFNLMSKKLFCQIFSSCNLDIEIFHFKPMLPALCKFTQPLFIQNGNVLNAEKEKGSLVELSCDALIA